MSLTAHDLAYFLRHICNIHSVQFTPVSKPSGQRPGGADETGWL